MKTVDGVQLDPGPGRCRWHRPPAGNRASVPPDLLDEALQGLHVLDDMPSRAPFDQSHRLEVLALPRDRLAVRRDAAGDLCVRRWVADFDLAPIAPNLACQAEQLGVDAVLDAQRAVLIYPFAVHAYQASQSHERAACDRRIGFQRRPERLVGHRSNDRLGKRHDVCRARLPVDRRQLAEHLAGSEVLEIDLLAVGRIQRRPDLPADHEKDIGRVVVLGDDLLARLKSPHVDLLGEALSVLDIEFLENADEVQCFGGSFHWPPVVAMLFGCTGGRLDTGARITPGVRPVTRMRSGRMFRSGQCRETGAVAPGLYLLSCMLRLLFGISSLAKPEGLVRKLDRFGIKKKHHWGRA